jgi:hypothetical protein
MQINVNLPVVVASGPAAPLVLKIGDSSTAANVAIR